MQKQEPNSEPKKTPNKSAHHMRYSDFQFIKLLGMGAYGKVQLVSRKGIKYALKIISKRLLAKEGKQYQAFIQKELLRKMKHPGVVALKTCFQDRQNLYFCLQFCQGGDFTTFMNNNEANITQKLRVFYVAQIVSIIEYFQSIGIVHRDLKPENILLSEKGHLKIIDFGTAEVTQCTVVDEKFKEQLAIQKLAEEEGENFVAKQLFSSVKKSGTEWQSTQKSQSSSDNEQHLSVTPAREVKRRKATFVGTCYYLPPQLLQTEACYPSADLWALGCIIYQSYYFNPPFDGASQFEIFQKIKNIQFSFPPNQCITQTAKDLIKQLLQRNPSERLGCNSREGLMMKDLKAHKFFDGINFSTLFDEEVPLLAQQYGFLSQKERQSLQQIGSKVMNEYLKLLQNNPNILIQGVIEKRTFINYNVYYLIVFNNLRTLRIKVTEPGKTRENLISLENSSEKENKENVPAEIVDNNFFKLITKQKVYKLKCEQPSRWVQTINKKYKQLKQLKQAKMEENQKNEFETIEKECKSISEMLKSVKCVQQ